MKNVCRCKVSEITVVSIAFVNKQQEMVNKKRWLRNVGDKKLDFYKTGLTNLSIIYSFCVQHIAIHRAFNPHQAAACDNLFVQDDRPGVLKDALKNILYSSCSQTL